MIHSRKRFGQHFLEPTWRARVVAACRISPGDSVLEIGPGRGALTVPLVDAGAHVLAVEVDRDLAGALEARALPALQVVTGDFLRLDWDALVGGWRRPSPAGAIRVVGNLPYNISSPILFRLLDVAGSRPPVRDATLMLQAEVAARLTAAVGTSDYGVLTLLVALHADVEPLLDLPPGAFRPVPKVRSTLVRLAFRPMAPAIPRPAAVSRLVRTSFTQRRKTMGNALKALGTADRVDAAAVIRAAGIDPMRRPETLHLVEFSALADAWATAAGTPAVL